MALTVDGLQEAQAIIPEGTYLAKYNGSKTVEFGDADEPQKAVVVSFVVTEEGDWAGEEITKFFNQDRRGLRYLKQFMEGIGAEVDGDTIEDDACHTTDYLLTINHYSRQNGEVVPSLKKVSIAS